MILDRAFLGMSSDSDAILDGEDAESEAPSNDAVVMDCYSESAVDMDTNHSSDQHAGREEGRGSRMGPITSWSEVCRPASLLRFTLNLKEADPKIDFFQWFRQLVNCTEGRVPRLFATGCHLGGLGIVEHYGPTAAVCSVNK